MMLLHLVPKLLLPSSRDAADARLADISIAELGLVLEGDKDVVSRQPYSNKRYRVACRKTGRAAVEGIFVETDRYLESFELVTRWEVLGTHTVVHRVRYQLLDRDFEAASTDMTRWYANGHDPLDQGRLPSYAKGWSPCNAEPCMEVFAGLARPDLSPAHHEAMASRRTSDRVNQHGWILERKERFDLPTIEMHRLHKPSSFRQPSIDDAFQAKVSS